MGHWPVFPSRRFTGALGVAAATAAVACGQTVPGTNRYPGFDDFPGGAPYLSLTATLPPVAGLKSASSSRRNRGTMADALRTVLTCALRTGNGRAPAYTMLLQSRWQEGWEPAPVFRLDTGPCLRYFSSVLARWQARLFHTPTGVRRRIGEIGVDAIAARTGLAGELESLLAVHGAVN